jgi:hypothetical protein
MACLATARIGPARQAFWAVWDRSERRLHERTSLGRGRVELSPGRARVDDAGVDIDLVLNETGGIETVCASGRSYSWTRKQGGIRAHGWITIHGTRREVAAAAVVDDTAAYFERHTRWRWSAGVGMATDGRAVAWNLVDGVNDPPASSERTIWIDGEPTELDPLPFDPALTRVGDLRFAAEATREHDQNLLLVRSRYRQPFGTFSGTIGGHALAEGYGVMEDHDVWW